MYHEIKFVNSTGRLMLKYGKKLIDYIFFNHFQVEHMTLAELQREAFTLARAHNIKEYALDLTEFKTC